jgi:hypothetical protein
MEIANSLSLAFTLCDYITMQPRHSGNKYFADKQKSNVVNQQLSSWNRLRLPCTWESGPKRRIRLSAVIDSGATAETSCFAKQEPPLRNYHELGCSMHIGRVNSVRTICSSRQKVTISRVVSIDCTVFLSRFHQRRQVGDFV